MTDQNSECPKAAIDIILSSYYISYNIFSHGFPLILQGHVMHTLKPDCTSVLQSSENADLHLESIFPTALGAQE